jgi:hypothetical protein
MGKKFTQTFQLLNQAYGEDWGKVLLDQKKVGSVKNQGVGCVFYWKGIVDHEFVPSGQMVNKQLYQCTGSCVAHHLQLSGKTSDIHCAPDLALADFFLFPKLKTTLKGRFPTIGEIQDNVTNSLYTCSVQQM